MGPSCKGYDVGVWVMMVAMVVMVGGKEVWAQDTPACAAKLILCYDYLNNSKPPDSCCNPLREAVQNELPCLCNLYSSPDLFKTFRINLTQATELHKHCGISSTLDLCNTTGATGGKSNACRGAGWVGLSSFRSLLFLWASVTV